MKSKPKSKDTLASKASQTLKRAKELVAEGVDAPTFWNSLFGVGALYGRLFSTEAERTAFTKTYEWKQIFELMDTLDDPVFDNADDAQVAASANGAISVRIPRSLHAALLREAKAEGVSLNQLCASKLSRQLAAAVS